MKYAIEIQLEIKWFIKGYDTYGFADNKCCYNLKTRRKLKQSYNNRCLGYWFGKSFVSLSKIKQLLYKKKESEIPF